MSAQNLTLNSDDLALVTDSVEQLEQQVKQIVVNIRSLTNTPEKGTEIVDGRPLALSSRTVMCWW